jgi:hypothetical protein
MEQTKLESFIETLMNVGIGFCVSYTAWPLVAYLADIPYSHSTNLFITLFFTVLSITRSYIVRRFFARGLHKASKQMAIKWTSSHSTSKQRTEQNTP